MRQSKSRQPTATIPTIPTVSKHFWAKWENPRGNGLEDTFFKPRKSQYHHCTPNQHSQLDDVYSQLENTLILELNGIKGIAFLFSANDLISSLLFK